MTPADGIPLAARVAEWRQKAQEGTMTIEEMREAVALLRAGRLAAAAAAPKTRTKAAGPTMSADEMLKGLE